MEASIPRKQQLLDWIVMVYDEMMKTEVGAASVSAVMLTMYNRVFDPIDLQLDLDKDTKLKKQGTRGNAASGATAFNGANINAVAAAQRVREIQDAHKPNTAAAAYDYDLDADLDADVELSPEEEAQFAAEFGISINDFDNKVINNNNNNNNNNNVINNVIGVGVGAKSSGGSGKLKKGGRIHVGPRGGQYVVQNGHKKYI